jgi:hypothetical protein
MILTVVRVPHTDRVASERGPGGGNRPGPLATRRYGNGHAEKPVIDAYRSTLVPQSAARANERVPVRRGSRSRAVHRFDFRKLRRRFAAPTSVARSLGKYPISFYYPSSSFC